jgi:hypothetical protein
MTHDVFLESDANYLLPAAVVLDQESHIFVPVELLLFFSMTVKQKEWHDDGKDNLILCLQFILFSILSVSHDDDRFASSLDSPFSAYSDLDSPLGSPSPSAQLG